MAAAPILADDDAIAVCARRLQAIHRALVAYERKHGQWPDHLSDLVPEYLPDQLALRDPADAGHGSLGSNEAHGDPKFRVSYSYERNGDVSNGLAQPLGRFPRPDIPGTSWGSWRLVNGHMETFFGDQVPVVRCYHHRPPEDEREPGRDLVLNLTPSGRIYRSDYDWRQHPDSLDFLLRTLERDLTQGPGWVLRKWLLWRVDEFFGNNEGLDRARHGTQMAAVAGRLFERHRELVGEERTACRMAAKLFAKLGETDRALAALEAAARFPGAPWSPIVEKQLRAEVLRAARRWDEEIATYQALLAERPDVRPYMEGLAAAYEAAGKPERAREWRDKADPGRLLVGKPAPAFRITLLDGTPMTLEEALRGRKALLLDFWFCACGPCRLEFPYLEQLHTAHKSRGLNIVAVNFGDSKDQVGQFARDYKASFPLALGRQADRDDPIFRAYRVSVYPTSFLIDASGAIVWRGVGFGPELKRDLSEALAKLGLKPEP
jgi:thiol-disulfide isomerase/thioredoxin